MVQRRKLATNPELFVTEGTGVPITTSGLRVSWVMVPLGALFPGKRTRELRPATGHALWSQRVGG